MMEPRQDELKTEISALQERLKKQEEENALYVRFLETENEIIEEQRQEELVLKKNELKKSKLISRIAIIGVVVSIFVCLTAFVTLSPAKVDADLQSKSAAEGKEISKLDTATAPAPVPNVSKTPAEERTEPGVNPLTEQHAKKETLPQEESVDWQPLYDNALAKLKLERLNPDAPVSSDVKRQLSELEKARKQLFKEAEYTFDDWYFKGVAEKERDACREAIGSFTEALKLNPKSGGAHSYRGYCYCKVKQYANAIADYTKAIKFNKGNAVAYYNRGGSYYYLKQYKPAIADYTRALKINPDDAASYYNRGTSYFNLNDYEKAIADYTSAIELDPDDADSYYNRGIVYSVTNQPAKAKDDIAKAKALNPQIR